MSVSQRTHLTRAYLFASPRLLQRVKQSLAEQEIVGALYSRLMQEAESDLERPFERSGDQIKEYPHSYGHRSEWYAESLEAHRVGSVISRLALCHAVSGRPHFANSCARHMAHAAKQPTSWDNPMQDLVIAALARSLCVAYDLTYDSGALGNRFETASVAALVEKRLLEMGDWLEYFLVKGGNYLRRNHDVIAACTLGLIALTLRAEAVSEEWLRLATNQLQLLLYADERCLGADGDWYESSFRYQVYILQWFHLFADAGRNLGLFDYYALPKTERFFKALSHYITPDGHNLGFNDTSHDEVIYLGLWALLKGAIEYQDEMLAWSLQQILAKLPETPLMAAEALLALEQGHPPSVGSVADRDRIIHFRRTDTVVARSGWSETASLFAIECGPSASHNHLSKGTFEYYYEGQPVILDTGCGHYVDRARWIVPEMHNIVVVDGGYKLRYPHPSYGTTGFDFSPDFQARIADIKSNNYLTFVQADFAGFARTAKAMRNCWFVSPGYLLIEDRIEAKAGRKAKYSAFFHAHGSVMREPKGKSVRLTTPQGMVVHLEVLEPSQGDLSIGKHPVATGTIGTVMSGVEFSIPPNRLLTLDYMQIIAEGQQAWFLVAILPESSRQGNVEYRLTKSNNGHVLQIDISDSIKDVWVFLDTPNPMAHGEIETDGRVAFVRAIDRKPSSWFVLDGKRLIYQEEMLIDSPVITTFLSH